MSDRPAMIGERDVVRFHHPASNKNRTGIVINIQNEAAIVIFCRGRQLEDLGACVTVPFPSAEASSLDLYKTTYFHARCVVRVRLQAVERVGHCPPALFARIRPIALQGVRYMVTLR
jgi:hypothetical protein